jgi:hypothetical protein
MPLAREDPPSFALTFTGGTRSFHSLPVGGNPGRWQAGRRVLGEQLAQQRRDAGRADRWWINIDGLEPPALAIGIGRLIQWSQRAQHGAAAGVDEIDTAEVPARIAQLGPLQVPVGRRVSAPIEF